MKFTDFTNHFLIAMPNLADPNFHHTVTFICAHNEDGAMGIVINRPLDMQLGEILAQMDLPTQNPAVESLPVYHGGPVQNDRGFILHSPDKQWDSSIQISPTISVTTSRDILQSIAAGNGPTESLVALGYAGWDAGQLELELTENAWLSGPADADVIFRQPCEQRWTAAARLLGIDIQTLSTDVGHA